MRKEVITCDRCGKDITLSVQMWNRQHHINLNLYYWHGGSMGGEEDIDNFNIDLCDECARDLSNNISKWLNSKKDA